MVPHHILPTVVPQTVNLAHTIGTPNPPSTCPWRKEVDSHAAEPDAPVHARGPPSRPVRGLRSVGPAHRLLPLLLHRRGWFGVGFGFGGKNTPTQ